MKYIVEQAENKLQNTPQLLKENDSLKKTNLDNQNEIINYKKEIT